MRTLLRIFGWIFIPFVMILVQWKILNKNARIIGGIWAGIMLLAIILNGGSDDKELVDSPVGNSSEVTVVDAKVDTTAQKAADKEAKKKAEADAKAKQKAEDQANADKEAKQKAEADAILAKEQSKQHQQDILDFEQSVYALEATVKPIMDNYQKIMLAVSEGNATIYDAYEAATNAKEAADHLQSEFFKLDVPKGLPKEVDSLLEDAKSDLSTAYYTKGNAFKAVLKFLDDQKPSNMQKFKDESSMSDSFIMSGVLKIMQAKEKVGIDITATQ